jgi:hypothetical protein
MQAACGIPLTVYGTGGQTRAFIHISDTCRCIELAVNNPPDVGNPVEILNQVAETACVRDVAEMVAELSGAEVTRVANPRQVTRRAPPPIAIPASHRYPIAIPASHPYPMASHRITTTNTICNQQRTHITIPHRIPSITIPHHPIASHRTASRVAGGRRERAGRRQREVQAARPRPDHSRLGRGALRRGHRDRPKVHRPLRPLQGHFQIVLEQGARGRRGRLRGAQSRHHGVGHTCALIGRLHGRFKMVARRCGAGWAGRRRKAWAQAHTCTAIVRRARAEGAVAPWAPPTSARGSLSNPGVCSLAWLRARERERCRTMRRHECCIVYGCTDWGSVYFGERRDACERLLIGPVQ